jgi:hypothetical protein
MIMASLDKVYKEVSVKKASVRSKLANAGESQRPSNSSLVESRDRVFTTFMRPAALQGFDAARAILRTQGRHCNSSRQTSKLSC